MLTNLRAEIILDFVTTTFWKFGKRIWSKWESIRLHISYISIRVYIIKSDWSFGSHLRCRNSNEKFVNFYDFCKGRKEKLEQNWSAYFWRSLNRLIRIITCFINGMLAAHKRPKVSMAIKESIIRFRFTMILNSP